VSLIGLGADSTAFIGYICSFSSIPDIIISVVFHNATSFSFYSTSTYVAYKNDSLQPVCFLLQRQQPKMAKNRNINAKWLTWFK